MKCINIKILIILIFMSGCSTENKQHDKAVNHSDNIKNSLLTYHFDNVIKPQTITLSEIGVEDIHYIPLETKKESLIGDDICDIKYYNNKFLIITYQNILLFDKDGSFISQIGARGKGPKEYLIAHDADFIPDLNAIGVLSRFEKKFYLYDYNGKFIKTIPSPEQADQFICSDSTILCHISNLYGKEENMFSVIDLKGNSIKNFSNKFKYKVGKISVSLEKESCLYKKGGQIFFKEDHCDTIFEYRNLMFTPSSVIDRGEKRLPLSARILNEALPYSTYRQYFSCANMIDLNQLIYYKIGYQDEYYYAIFKLVDGSQIVKYSKDKFTNDIDGGPKISFDFKKNDNEIATFVTPFELKSYVASDAFKNFNVLYPNKKKALEQFANKLKEDDNPVLMLMKLKK